MFRYRNSKVRQSAWERRKEQNRALVEGYTAWLLKLMMMGYDVYFTSCMFERLPGRERSLHAQMQLSLDRVYGILANQSERTPRRPGAQQRLPRMLMFPDYPVHKRAKDSLLDVTINGGLHYQGVIAVHPESRLYKKLAHHIGRRRSRYQNQDTHLRTLDVEPMDTDIGRVTRYLLKAHESGRAIDMDFVVYPKARTELSARRGGDRTDSEVFS